ncbi:hypothetical protein [Streptomyces anulatus]|uniref:hypothetical protein n=1 Tax=Streptomyces anulatus TaxID=1892 RepID=UPI003318FBD5
MDAQKILSKADEIEAARQAGWLVGRRAEPARRRSTRTTPAGARKADSGPRPFGVQGRGPPAVSRQRLTTPLHSSVTADQERRGRNDFQRFVMVLVCVHALSGTDMRHLLLTDLDLSRERLIVRRPGKRHIIYLDELTYRCASAWLRGGHRRWPVTTNPHLLINRWTAVDTTHSPIGAAFTNIFRPTGLTMPTLRQDRIRDEAFEVDDPLHLMRLFGISSQTAMRYITAAHPERTAKLPR